MDYDKVITGIPIKSIEYDEDNGTLGVTAIVIVQTVLESCKKEKEQSHLFLPLNDFQGRASYYTGIPVPKINQLCDKTADHNFIIDVPSQILILKMLKILYLSRINAVEKHLILEPITLISLHEQLKSHLNIPSVSDFSQMMQKIGYEMVKLEKIYQPTLTHIVIENPLVTFNRIKLLKKIQRMRDMEKMIYYIDARIKCQAANYTTQLYGSPFKDNIIFFQMFSKHGYESGTFCQSDDFLNESLVKWILFIVISTIKPASLILIHNNLFKGTQSKKSISAYHSKMMMLNWLKENNVPCNTNMCKAELFELIQKCSIRKNPNIEHIFRAHGHEVFCLPDSLTDLSINTHAWREISEDINNLNFDKRQGELYKESTINTIKKIPSETFLNFDKTIQEFEQEFLDMNKGIEPLLDKLHIQIEADN